MKIYTKAGDKGETSIIGGRKLSKAHIKIEAFGQVDELNAHLGLILCFVDLVNAKLLKDVQNALFVIGSILASEIEQSTRRLPVLRYEEVGDLENAIDSMELTLQPMTNFILPGGSIEVAQIHLARCVCRRAERTVVHLNEIESVNDLVCQYLNRLSDYLFVLARYHASKSNVEEIKWIAKD